MPHHSGACAPRPCRGPSNDSPSPHGQAHDGEARRRDFENFVRTAGHRLPPPPPPSLPADAGPLVAAADPSAGVVQLALCQLESSAVYQAAEQVAANVAHEQLYLRWW
ncbi:MAG: hypothetical protein AAGF86_20465 [Pseudomonadota bacterium]